MNIRQNQYTRIFSFNYTRKYVYAFFKKNFDVGPHSELWGPRGNQNAEDPY
jgi:hypothetical protein